MASSDFVGKRIVRGTKKYATEWRFGLFSKAPGFAQNDGHSSCFQRLWAGTLHAFAVQVLGFLPQNRACEEDLVMGLLSRACIILKILFWAYSKGRLSS